VNALKASRHAVCFHMSHTNEPRPRKPYEIRERLFVFACDVVRMSQKLHTRNRFVASLCELVKNVATIIRNASPPPER